MPAWAFFDRYRTPADLPQRIPVFPLSGRAAAAAGRAAAQHLRAALSRDGEPRAWLDDRLIGMIQPAPLAARGTTCPPLHEGGLRRPHHRLCRNADERMLITLTGVSPLPGREELEVDTPYRQVVGRLPSLRRRSRHRSAAPGDVNRPALLKAFRDYLDANNMKADWERGRSASTEVLVNTLSLLAPYAAAGEAGTAGSARPQDPCRGSGGPDRDGAEQDGAWRQAAAAVDAGMTDVRTDPRLLELLVCPVTKTPAVSMMPTARS